MDTDHFIERVKEWPILYNTQHPQYRNFSQKTEIWNKIAEEMNESSDVLRVKWKGLKDGYTKYKKWILFRHASAKPYSHWCWGPRLEFLDPYIHKHKKNDNVSTTKEHTMESTKHDVLVDDQKFANDDTLQTECIFQFETSSGMSSPSSFRSPSRLSLRDPIATTETNNKEKLVSFIQTKRSNDIDAVDLLFMSYVKTFKSFSVETQTKLKVNMATIFAEAELQEHKLKHSTLT